MNPRKFTPKMPLSALLMMVSIILLLASYYLNERTTTLPESQTMTTEIVPDTAWVHDTIRIDVEADCICNEDIYSSYIGIPLPHLLYWDSLRSVNENNAWGANNNPYMMGKQRSRSTNLIDTTIGDMVVYVNKKMAFIDLILWYSWNPPKESETIGEYLSRRSK